jgi:DNA-binding Lrp family transcriptional regulator
MMDVVLDDLDQQLLHALQIAPRASWSTLAPILRTDPSTLSRRWARLTSEGLAWTTCYLLPERMQAYSLSGDRLRSSLSAVDIRCAPGLRGDVARSLASKSAIINVDCTSGERDLTISVAAANAREIDDYVSEHVAVLPGIVSTSTRFIRTIYREGSDWELDAIRPDQRGALERQMHPGANLTPAPPSDLADAVIHSLQADARRPASEIAQEVGISVALARRTVAALTRSDWVRMRADFAHSVLGWNASVHLSMRVPQDRIETLSGFLARQRSTRLCASTLGPDNVTVVLWMREIEELDGLESSIRQLIPESTISDRWMVARSVKRMGTLFDNEGRRTGFVPVPLPRIAS